MINRKITAIFCGVLMSSFALLDTLNAQQSSTNAPIKKDTAVQGEGNQQQLPESPNQFPMPSIQPPSFPGNASLSRTNRLGAPNRTQEKPIPSEQRTSESRRVFTPPSHGSSRELLSASSVNNSSNPAESFSGEENPTAFTTLELDNPDEIMPVGAWQLQNMPLAAFIDVYADLVGRTVIQPATLGQALINFKMKTPLTKKELVQALEGVLIVNQVAIVPTGKRFVTAVPLADAAGQGAKINEMNLKEIPESLQFMTQIVQLTNSYPSEILASIQPFAKIPNGIVAIEESKLLVIRDYAVNVKRMMEIIKRVDVIPEDDYVFKVIPIRYGTVEDVNNVMGSLIGTSSYSSSSSRNLSNTSRNTGTSSSRSSLSSSRNNRTSSSSRLSASQMNMQRLGSGANTFANRMGNIMNRASSANQQVSLLMDEAQVIPDERSNSLIVYATKRDMEVITNVVSQLDFLLPQVLIESVIVDVTLGDSFSFGVSAAQSRTNGTDFKGFGGMFNGQGVYSSVAGNAGNYTNMPSGFSYFGRLNDEWEFGVVAEASDNRATVLQRPRILTMHGVEASFFNGQRIPYASSSYYGGYTSSANVSFDYLDVGIELAVTPFITQDGMVIMEISQTIDEFSQWVEMGNDLRAPQTVNRDATAMIAVKDKESIMLGGYIRQSKTKNNSGVPYLKDIPLLGYFFRNTSKSDERSELLVFIRPTILNDPESIREFSKTESQTLPGAYMALNDYNRETRSQMYSALEQEKAIELKEKKELLKFQERMNELDKKTSETQKKLDEIEVNRDLPSISIEVDQLPIPLNNSSDSESVSTEKELKSEVVE